MAALSKVQSHPDFVRDESTKAILNNNLSEFMEFKKKKQITEDIKSLKLEVGELKSLILDLKLALQQIR